MSGRRAPVERLVDLAVAIPVSVAAAARQLLPVGVTRLERRIARDLTLIQRSARRRVAAPGQPAPPVVAGRPADPDPATPAPSMVEPARPSAMAVDLPIDGYDQLSARQIVDRLPALSADELSAVEAHERTHRRRQTVLARIAQLS